MILATMFLSGVTITLPARAEVRGTEIELGEVATLRAEDANLVQTLADFDLGYAPAPGFSRLFDAQRIADRLRSSYPELEFRFAGQSSCRVHPETERLTGPEILEVARQSLQTLTEGRDIQFDPSGEIPDLLVPAGEQAAQLRLRRGPLELRHGKNSVPIEVLVDGSTYQTVWTSWEVEKWHSVLVLTRDVPAGEQLTADCVELKRVSQDASGASLGIRREALIGTRAARALRRGEVLQRNDVTQLDLIHRGDAIVLEVKKGSVCARVSAVASEDGHLGERIRIVTTDTQRELSAVVIGRDRVQIDMTPSH
jgi:flagella basal body P-ring formation protein FlgA